MEGKGKKCKKGKRGKESGGPGIELHNLSPTALGLRPQALATGPKSRTSPLAGLCRPSLLPQHTPQPPLPLFSLFPPSLLHFSLLSSCTTSTRLQAHFSRPPRPFATSHPRSLAPALPRYLTPSLPRSVLHSPQLPSCPPALLPAASRRSPARPGQPCPTELLRLSASLGEWASRRVDESGAPTERPLAPAPAHGMVLNAEC